MTKTCRRCGKERELSAFPARADSPDGRHGWCTRCHVVRQQERREAVRARLEDEDYQRRFADWQRRILAQHEQWNELARQRGWTEEPPPDVEPGWLDRLQARVAARQAARRR